MLRKENHREEKDDCIYSNSRQQKTRYGCLIISTSSTELRAVLLFDESGMKQNVNYFSADSTDGFFRAHHVV